MRSLRWSLKSLANGFSPLSDFAPLMMAETKSIVSNASPPRCVALFANSSGRRSSERVGWEVFDVVEAVSIDTSAISDGRTSAVSEERLVNSVLIGPISGMPPPERRFEA